MYIDACDPLRPFRLVAANLRPGSVDRLQAEAAVGDLERFLIDYEPPEDETPDDVLLINAALRELQTRFWTGCLAAFLFEAPTLRDAPATALQRLRGALEE